MQDYKKLVEALRCCGNEGCHKCPYQKHIHEHFCWTMAMHEAADAIEALQAETIRLWPKRGKWINSKERMRPDMCSVCGCIYKADRFMDRIAWHFCPYCGAKMEVQE